MTVTRFLEFPSMLKKKTFDFVDHKILLNKLNKYEFKEFQTIELKLFLENRSKQVWINDVLFNINLKKKITNLNFVFLSCKSNNNTNYYKLLLEL